MKTIYILMGRLFYIIIFLTIPIWYPIFLIAESYKSPIEKEIQRIKDEEKIKELKAKGKARRYKEAVKKEMEKFASEQKWIVDK